MAVVKGLRVSLLTLAGEEAVGRIGVEKRQNGPLEMMMCTLWVLKARL